MATASSSGPQPDAQQQQQPQQQALAADAASEPIISTTAQPQPQQQQQQQPPASPPLPARHTAATPGPRAAALQQAFDGALSRTLAKLEWANFAACYPTAASRAPNSLRAVQARVVALLGEKSRREFAAILEERDVVRKLNELESLVSEAGRRRRREGGEAGGGGGSVGVPPHLLPPEDVLDAHLSPHLASQQSQLNARLQTSQAHNARLFEEIQRQRAEAEALLAELEAACADIDGANSLLGEVADSVAEESRAVEVEMGGV